MSDLTDLPLFTGVPVAEASTKRRGRRRSPEAEGTALGAEPPAASATGSAVIVMFPPSRDVRLIADLARVFLDLRERHGRRSRAMLLTRRFKPIAARLRRMGAPAAAIERELAEIEAAVTRSVWRHDGCPSVGAGGGHAA